MDISSIFSFLRESFNIQTFLLFMVVLVLTYTYTTYRKVKIPGPVALPLIGNFLNLLGVNRKDRHLYFRNLHKQYGDIYRLYFGQRLVIFLNNYDLINEALIFSTTIGVVWSNGTKWKTLRRFTLHTLRDFGLGKKSLEEVIKQEANGVFEQFEKQKGHGFLLKPIFTVAVSNVINSIVFGCRIKRLFFDEKDFLHTKHNSLRELCIVQNVRLAVFSIENRKNPYFEQAFITSDHITYGHDDKYFKDILNCFDFLVKFDGALGITFFYPILRYFKIVEHETTFNSDNIRDFVDLYINQEREGTMDKEIFTRAIITKILLSLLQTLNLLFGAGTETTATTLEWAILYMIEYPEIQEKCREEIKEKITVGNKGNFTMQLQINRYVIGDGRMVVLADKKELHYVNATLCEVQRIASIAPLGVLHMASEDCELAGYQIPKKSIIIAHQAAAHMDPKIWDQPDQFRPERFLDENKKFCKSEKLIPFSTVRNKDEDILDFNGQYGVTKSTLSHKVKALIR
ncbi:LOW QUALITY PROTEIN: hypothetical protein KUTeg_009533 [Tegillarca granosa]|uniref:Cytochrome P450 n=1 Tax=Tegillarca granosa TaxID=220873 RepID=A0ABQ9F7A4_TEGGR|nr:LOW QUALITY PROTEIN: hypothetical protein KUTeg_009533 [Tegillarca granosa]